MCNTSIRFLTRLPAFISCRSWYVCGPYYNIHTKLRNASLYPTSRYSCAAHNPLCELFGQQHMHDCCYTYPYDQGEARIMVFRLNTFFDFYRLVAAVVHFARRASLRLQRQWLKNGGWPHLTDILPVAVCITWWSSFYQTIGFILRRFQFHN